MNAVLWMILQTTTLGATNYATDVSMTAPTEAPSFSDEFDGTKVDRKKWLFDTHRNKLGWYNNERQYYLDERRGNARIEKGTLVLEARRESLRAAQDWGGRPTPQPN